MMGESEVLFFKTLIFNDLMVLCLGWHG